MKVPTVPESTKINTSNFPILPQSFFRKRNFYSGLCKSFAHSDQFLLQIQPLAVFKLSKSETKQRKN
jgi:hypothetical protein